MRGEGEWREKGCAEMSAPLIQATLRLKNNQLQAVLRAAARNYKGMPSYLANSTCQGISYKAMKAMPVVRADAIRRELEVERVGLTAKGNISKAKKPRVVHVTANPFGNSLGSRIILASFYPNSRFNRTTGGVFMRRKPDTKGQAAFLEWLMNTTAHMAKTRFSSSGFFAAVARGVNVGFGMALGRFMPKGVTMTVEGGATTGMQKEGLDPNKASKLLNKGLAQVFPARGENGLARFTVSTTEPDTKGNQGALERKILPVWQRAVDDEVRFRLKKIPQDIANNLRTSGLVVVTD